jgi:hypothetical protein
VYGAEHVDDSEKCSQRVEVSEPWADVGIDTTLTSTVKARRNLRALPDLVGTAGCVGFIGYS